MKISIDFNERKVIEITRKANGKTLRRAGAYVRKAARNMVSRSKNSSSPGTPPNTRKGLLKRSILFGLDKVRNSVVIGPAFKFIGIVMTAHEFGGMFRRRKYPKRPLMGPTLQKTSSTISKFWEDSIKQ